MFVATTQRLSWVALLLGGGRFSPLLSSIYFFPVPRAPRLYFFFFFFPGAVIWTPGAVVVRGKGATGGGGGVGQESGGPWTGLSIWTGFGISI